MRDAASFHISGLPAILIILAILAVLITGVVVIVRAAGRKAKKMSSGE